MLVSASLVPFAMLCVKKTERRRQELFIDEDITGHSQELEAERNNLVEVGITGSVKRTRNSVCGEAFLVSSV